MSIKAHYYVLNDSCLYCGKVGSEICRVTVIEGQLQGVAVMCQDCGRQERDVAIAKGYYSIPIESHDGGYPLWVQPLNKGEKN